jgi:hypothetical protein
MDMSASGGFCCFFFFQNLIVYPQLLNIWFPDKIASLFSFPDNTHSTVEEVLRKKAGCDLESRSRFYQKSRKLAKCGLIYGNEEGAFSATPSLTLIVIRTRSLLRGREMGRLGLAQAAYCGDRGGAGNDLELRPRPEHAVEIITLRSPA